MSSYPSGGYHDREGLTSAYPSRQPSRRLFVQDSPWTVAFSAIIIGQALIALALEAYVFGKFETALEGTAQKESPARAIPTYLALFIFAFVYQIGLTYDALRNKNTIQIIGLCLYNFGMVIYASIEYGQVNSAVQYLQNEGEIVPNSWLALKPYLLAAPCILALGSLLLSGVAFKIYRVWEWQIFKSISADIRMRNRYLTFQIYIALLKFDFFFFLGFTVQFLVIVGNNFADAEFWLTIAAVPVTVIILLLAAFVCQRESRVGHLFIIFIYFAGMAYFIFKLIRMYDTRNPEKIAEYYAARTSLTTFAIITLILLIITIGSAIFCMRNFGQGLKRFVMKGGSTSHADAKLGGHNDQEYGQQLGTVPGRMVID